MAEPGILYLLEKECKSMKSLFTQFLFIAAIAVGLPAISFAQQTFPPLPEAKRPHIRAEITTAKIKIDGKDVEPAWQKAPVATNFKIAYPSQGKNATYNTEVRILYDNVNLYIFARCNFPQGKKAIQVQDMRRDFNFDSNELFEVVINPFKDPRSPVMGFSVTPFGTQMDIMHYADDTFDYNWDAVWQAASDIQEHSWITEIAIPFSTLRYPKNSTEWSINFIRNIRYKGELNGWSEWPQSVFESRVEYGGIVTNIAPPMDKLNLQIDPYALVTSTAVSKKPVSYKSALGGEIKYAINTNTFMEGTVHTDFAQAEADVKVINLTRSNVFFPEKRQFFLENSSMFSTGQKGYIQPFFSRRIGLSADGSPLTIDGGVRFIHQDTKSASGLLIMKQQGDSTQTGALFGVFRYKQNVSDKLQIGGMAVLKENLAGLGQQASLNPVGVVDALWRINPSLQVRGMGSLSGNSLNKQTGNAGFAELEYTTNTFWITLFETEVSKGYQAQAGYVQRDNFINTQPSAGLNIHRDWFPKNIAFYNFQASANIYHEQSTGRFQEADVNIIPCQLTFNDLALLNFNVTSSWQDLTGTFAPVRNVNIAAGNYKYNRYELYGTTNQAAHFSLESRLSTGGYYNGTLNSYFFSVRAEPVARLALLVSYTRNDLKGVGIGNARTTSQLVAPELRTAVNPKLLLSAFYQYDTDARAGSLNARFSWEYRPLSFVYFVVNTVNNYYKTPFDIPQRQQNAILKITYIHQI